MSKANPEWVELFCTKAAVVGAKVQRAASLDDAVHYIMDVCIQKNPCELLADEAGTEKGPDSPNRVPTRTQRLLAAPGVQAKLSKALEKACAAQNVIFMNANLRTRLAGIDMGVSEAILGVAASGTCMLNADNEEARLASMICEISIILLRASTIRPDLPSIAPDLRAQQNTGKPAYTAFVTGPSRTADIERIPAVGVHGPLELHIILLED